MYLTKPAIIEFDASNKEHRRAARAFLKRKAWVDCPMRFAHDPEYGSVAEQIQAKLLVWYVAQEEAADSKKNTAKIIKDALLPSMTKTGDKNLAFDICGIGGLKPSE